MDNTEKKLSKTARQETAKNTAATTAKKSTVVKEKTVKNETEKKIIKKTAETKDKVRKGNTAKGKVASAKNSSEKRATKEIKNVKAIAQDLKKEKSKKSSDISSSKEGSKGVISDFDIYLFHQGRNYLSYNFMGAHHKCEKRKWGVRFTTWAPRAQEIYVVGNFCSWKKKEEYKMEKLTEQGLWTVFIPGLEPGEIYKYAVLGADNKFVMKADPYGRRSELRPNTASIIVDNNKYKWNDRKWLNKRLKTDIFKSPLNIYELHLGSWKRNKEGELLTYRELAEELPAYVKEMGYTHVELMPVMEHPLDASWGYQVLGYYALTSRFGTIEDFKYLVDTLHQEDIGVILDWVPGHFCKDLPGLYRFDGSPTYEYQDPVKSENHGWGASNFDLGRPEVKSFLVSNALYWIREFHVDGLRVDAVANMLYLDYEGHKNWTPNIYGGNENLEAIEFIKELNTAIYKEFPQTIMIAEESTTYPMVTRPVEEGGLGFKFKWNMGWMNDILEYIELDPVYRKFHHNLLTFSMMYAYNENFILPISHDEVVHGKKSLVDKNWGDYWNKFAGMRAVIAYMFTHPGKKTLFMGSDFAQFIEWRFYEELEWKLINQFEMHKKTQHFFKAINEFYKENKALWEQDYDYNGFQWIDADNANQSILLFMRKTENPEDTLIVVINFTPVVYYNYKVGVPFEGKYEEVLNTDDENFGGSGQVMGEELIAQPEPWHNQKYHVNIKVPPMAAVILKYTK